jgi:hypothetical protein
MNNARRFLSWFVILALGLSAASLPTLWINSALPFPLTLTITLALTPCSTVRLPRPRIGTGAQSRSAMCGGWLLHAYVELQPIHDSRDAR